MFSTAIGTYFDDEGCKEKVPMNSHLFISMTFETLDIVCPCC